MYLLLLPFLSLLSLFQPAQTGPTDSLTIFSPTRTYHYAATFVSPAGDTLSRERITLQPSGTPWKFQKKTQTAFDIYYGYSSKDSVTFLSYQNPQTKKKEKPKRYFWYRKITTGAIENAQQVWMHPIRDNQYNYTEVAPFPEVKLDSLKEGGKWTNVLAIMMGWGAFKGKMENHYQAMRQETKQYGSLSLNNCWLIQATGKHSTLGNNHLDFYFHPSYGFTEMHYRFYDGAKISFVLAEVQDKKQL